MNHLQLLVTFKLKPDTRSAFLEDMYSSGIYDKINGEEGCVRYNYFLDALDRDTLLLVEEWTDEKYQIVHLSAPHMADYKVIKDKYVLETKLEKAIKQ